MLQDYFSKKIERELPFTPTADQHHTTVLLGEFLQSPSADKLFLLNGYAGTGKTSLISALVRALHQLKKQTVLLAPTGRAAKVISSYAGFQAYTIHKKIYRQKNLSTFEFGLNDNLHKETLFIVDEASMISNSGMDSRFGTGRLLDDLITFVYSGRNCSLLLLGDTAQLPPVGQAQSPALDKHKLASYGLEVMDYTLTEVVRQDKTSGILLNATLLRKQIAEAYDFTPYFDTENSDDVFRSGGVELIDAIQVAYDREGVEESIIVTRSNKRANMYNKGIRGSVLMREEEMGSGDLLMITRNNYFWAESYENIDFLANGDIVVITRISNHTTMYDFRFADITLQSLDYGWEIEAKVWLDTIYVESSQQMQELQNTLFQRVCEDYPEIRNRRALIKKVYENEFFNALQVKFSYAITCHKAQGGQWKNVFIDPGYFSGTTLDVEYLRWLYTAITRASENVFLINYPDEWFG